METLGWATVIVSALIISWLGGFGVGDQGHPIGWVVLFLELIMFVFFVALLAGVLLNLVNV